MVLANYSVFFYLHRFLSLEPKACKSTLVAKSLIADYTLFYVMISLPHVLTRLEY
jgi:hypothetical protein